MSTYGNNRILNAGDPSSSFITIGATQEKYCFGNLGIPFMIKRNSDREYLAHVKGEVWEVKDNDVVAHMDALEGHPNGYRREPLVVLDFLTGHPYECEGYFYQHKVQLTKPNYFTEDLNYHSWPIHKVNFN